MFDRLSAVRMAVRVHACNARLRDFAHILRACWMVSRWLFGCAKARSGRALKQTHADIQLAARAHGATAVRSKHQVLGIADGRRQRHPNAEARRSEFSAVAGLAIEVACSVGWRAVGIHAYAHVWARRCRECSPHATRNLPLRSAKWLSRVLLHNRHEKQDLWYLTLFGPSRASAK